MAALAATTGLLAVPTAAQAHAVITVTSAADPGDGTCSVAPGECTLREAIKKANTSSGTNSIRFAIGSGPVTIAPLTDLPALTDPVDIDGTSQPGYTGQPIVRISGQNNPGGAGLRVETHDSTLRGLAISGSQTGVVVAGYAANNAITRNSISDNGGLGIDLGGDGIDANDAGDGDVGANHKQNYPVLTTVASGPGGVRAVGTLNSKPSSTFRVEVVANAACDSSGYGEGQFVVGAFDVTTDAYGNAAFDRTLAVAAPAGYESFAATASRSVGYGGYETSEFSACVPAFTPPGAPTGVAAGAGDGLAQVTWLAPDTTGGSPIDHYTITSSPDTATTPLDVPAGTTTATVLGLTNGTPYVFSVTATNGVGLTGPSSAAFEAVTPLPGSALPEAATADVGANGSLSTGGSATPADPTNTTIETPNSGIVSIGEGAMTGTPPAGVTYVGQQIDVNAPDAAAADPMRFSFVIDCSRLPVGTATCPPPAGIAAKTVASTYVSVKDGFYSPATAVAGQGSTVTWNFVGAKTHSVVDDSRLGPGGYPLFSSGNRAPGSSYSYTFRAAGSYPYRSTTSGDPTSMRGTIAVPIDVSAATGDTATPITLTWSGPCPSGYRFDVQYRFKPSGGSFGVWKSFRTNTTSTSATFTGDSLKGAGSYEFRSRLENIGTSKTSGWSPSAAVTIVPSGPPHLADFAVFHETGTGNVEVPDCTGPEGVAQPAPACTWSEVLTSQGDLEVVVFTDHNNRWRVGKIALP